MIDQIIGLCKELRIKIQNTDADKKNTPILAYFKMQDILSSYTEESVIDNFGDFLGVWNSVSEWLRNHKISFTVFQNDTWYDGILRVVLTRSILDTIISEDYTSSDIDIASEYFIDSLIELLRRVYDSGYSLANITLSSPMEDSGLWCILPTIYRRNDSSFMKSIIKIGQEWLDKNGIRNDFSNISDEKSSTRAEDLLQIPVFIEFEGKNPYDYKKFYNETPIEV